MNIALYYAAIKCEATNKSLVGGQCLPQPIAGQNTFNTILNIVLVTIGALAVLVIVLAGVRYILSQGNADKVSAAKRQLIYGLVGLVVIMFAMLIVNFVIDSLI